MSANIVITKEQVDSLVIGGLDPAETDILYLGVPMYSLLRASQVLSITFLMCAALFCS